MASARPAAKTTVARGDKRTIVELTPEQTAAWQKKLEPLTESWVRNTPDGEKVLAAYRAELAKIEATSRRIERRRRDAEQARGLARGIADYWQEQLGERFLGFYLIGSLAHGGFSARYSDIDVGLVSTDGVTPIEIEAMRQHARKRSPELAPNCRCSGPIAASRSAASRRSTGSIISIMRNR